MPNQQSSPFPISCSVTKRDNVISHTKTLDNAFDEQVTPPRPSNFFNRKSTMLNHYQDSVNNNTAQNGEGPIS